LTLYTRWGDWVAWLSIAVTIGLLLKATAADRRSVARKI
jgi:hypothetical protein